MNIYLKYLTNSWGMLRMTNFKNFTAFSISLSLSFSGDYGAKIICDIIGHIWLSKF